MSTVGQNMIALAREILNNVHHEDESHALANLVITHLRPECIHECDAPGCGHVPDRSLDVTHHGDTDGDGFDFLWCGAEHYAAEPEKLRRTVVKREITCADCKREHAKYLADTKGSR